MGVVDLGHLFHIVGFAIELVDVAVVGQRKHGLGVDVEVGILDVSACAVVVLGLKRVVAFHRQDVVEFLDDVVAGFGLVHLGLGGLLLLSYFLLGHAHLGLDGVVGRNPYALLLEDGDGRLVVALAALEVASQALGLGTSHVARFKAWILVQDAVVVGHGLAKLASAHVELVVEREEVGRLQLEHFAEVGNGFLVLPHLGAELGTVVDGRHVVGLQPYGIVVVAHCTSIVIDFILEIGTVDEIAGIARLELDE